MKKMTSSHIQPVFRLLQRIDRHSQIVAQLKLRTKKVEISHEIQILGECHIGCLSPIDIAVAYEIIMFFTVSQHQKLLKQERPASMTKGSKHFKININSTMRYFFRKISQYFTTKLKFGWRFEEMFAFFRVNGKSSR